MVAGFGGWRNRMPGVECFVVVGEATLSIGFEGTGRVEVCGGFYLILYSQTIHMGSNLANILGYLGIPIGPFWPAI